MVTYDITYLSVYGTDLSAFVSKFLSKKMNLLIHEPTDPTISLSILITHFLHFLPILYFLCFSFFFIIRNMRNNRIDRIGR